MKFSRIILVLIILFCTLFTSFYGKNKISVNEQPIGQAQYKGIITLLLGLLLIVIVPCSYLLFTYWLEMPIFIKIFWPILLAIIFIAVIITPLNGIIITKKETILFLPDFRLKKFYAIYLEKM